MREHDSTNTQSSEYADSDHPTSGHPSWCDPNRCQADEWAAADRQHRAALGTEIDLTMQDEVKVQGVRYGLPTLSVIVDQNVRDAEPTISLYSEAAHPHTAATKAIGIDLELTRTEAVDLRDELTRRIDETGSDALTTAYRLGYSTGHADGATGQPSIVQ